jgi:hypothetical protein
MKAVGQDGTGTGFPDESLRPFRSWCAVRSAPLVGTIAMLAGGMAYVIGWGVLRHHGVWSTPPDLWGISRSALAVAHGNFAGVYFPNVALTGPPGLEFVLVPVVALGEGLGLHPLIPGSGASPHLWLLLGPAALLIGSTVLFALDAVARRWALSVGRRMVLALVVGAGITDVVVAYGHPEDCAAVALMVWAALARDDGPEGIGRAGWLFGLAIALQPMAVLGIVPVFATIPPRRVPPLLLRLALPSVIVLAPVLATSASHAIFVLVHQPSYPISASSTPFSGLTRPINSYEVTAGPMRLVSTTLSAAVAYLVCRRRSDLPTVLTMTAVAFALRVLLETELVGYYFWPIAALCVLLALRRSWRRFWIVLSAAFANVMLGSYNHKAIAVWWPTIMATVLIMLAAAALPVEPTPAVECEVMHE